MNLMKSNELELNLKYNLIIKNKSMLYAQIEIKCIL